MPLIATPARRRLAMAAMLTLAVSGAVLRHVADDPSTLRDIGTLLLVMWLPAVGNLVAWVVGKLPRRTPANTPRYAATFTPHIRLRLTPFVPAPRGAALGDSRVTLVAGKQAFSGRLAQPWGTLAGDGPFTADLELLRPEAAAALLVPGARVHLLVGTIAVAQAEVQAPAPHDAPGV